MAFPLVDCHWELLHHLYVKIYSCSCNRIVIICPTSSFRIVAEGGWKMVAVGGLAQLAQISKTRDSLSLATNLQQSPMKHAC